MNTRHYLLTLAAACGLPALALAQGTYLSAPGGDPTNALAVAPGGNVGIGTAAARSKLHVITTGDYAGEFEKSTPTANAWIKIVNDARSYLVGVRGDTGNSFVVYDNVAGVDCILVDTSGNVGIGTSSPQAKLDVAGNIRCTVLDLTSDRNAKTGFAPVDCAEILEKLARLPISTWQYTNAPGVKRLGPMAQDFRAAFALGSDDKHIATVDADGVALAAIQALYQELVRCDVRVKAKEARLTRLEEQLHRLERQLVARTALPEREETLAARDDAAPVPSATATLPPGVR